MDARHQFLSDLLEQFLAERQAWVDDSDAKFVTEDLERSVEELIEGFAEGSIPAELRGVEHVISTELSPAWNRFRQLAGATGDVRILPDDTFWQAVTNIERAQEKAAPGRPITIETIAQLTEQKVSDRQICLMYDWVDERGNPELWKLREEREKPGTHTAGWVPSVERRRLEQEERTKQLRQQVAARQAKKVERLTAPCKESIEELLQQGLSAAQIADMRRCAIAEVLAEADRLGLPRPPLRYASAGVNRAPHDPEPNESAARVFDASAKNTRGKARKSSPARRQPAPPADLPDDSADDLLGDDLRDGDQGEVYDPAGATGDYDEDQTAGPDGGDLDGQENGAGSNEAAAGAMTLEQEIVSYHQNGMDAQAIAKAVSVPGAKVTVGKVRAIVERFANEPGAFA